MSTQYASAHRQREAAPGAALRQFEVTHGKLFTVRERFAAKSEYALRTELMGSHPEWWPIVIVEVGSDQ